MARTFNAVLLSCERRFVMNYRKLMTLDGQQQAVIDSQVKVTARAIALCRGKKALDSPQPIKECLSSSSTIQRAVGCRAGFNVRFRNPPPKRYHVFDFLADVQAPQLKNISVYLLPTYAYLRHFLRCYRLVLNEIFRAARHHSSPQPAARLDHAEARRTSTDGVGDIAGR